MPNDNDEMMEELRLNESELQIVEADYQRRYGQYDIEDFHDLIVWAHELEPKDSEIMDQNERMGILIRLLHIKSIAAQASADLYKQMYENCGELKNA